MMFNLFKKKKEKIYYEIGEKDIEEKNMFKICAPFLYEVDTENVEACISDLKKFNQEQINVFVLNNYLGEVANGGHDQFFSNSSGIFSAEVLTAMEQLNLNKHYKNFKKVIDKFPNFPAKDRESRNEQLEVLELNFENQDNWFYENDGEFFEVLEKYIDDNKEKFYYSGYAEDENLKIAKELLK